MVRPIDRSTKRRAYAYHFLFSFSSLHILRIVSCGEQRCAMCSVRLWNKSSSAKDFLSSRPKAFLTQIVRPHSSQNSRLWHAKVGLKQGFHPKSPLNPLRLLPAVPTIECLRLWWTPAMLRRPCAGAGERLGTHPALRIRTILTFIEFS